MTTVRLLVLLMYAAGGAAGALIITRALVTRVPDKLVRANINDKNVPAILGIAVVGAGCFWLAVIVVIEGREDCCGVMPVLWAAGLVALALGAAGLWDDLRGHELPRGFRGHLGAVRGGKLTGGMVKLLAGGLAGVAAGAIVGHGWGIVETGLLVALAANFVNLLDRAPGRAGKAVLGLGLPFVALGDPGWATAAVPFLGALTATLSLDLRERAILGDAGANPLGGLVGLAAAVSFGPSVGWACVALLLLLNVASERYSFSRAIARSPLLNRLDMIGRKEGS